MIKLKFELFLFLNATFMKMYVVMILYNILLLNKYLCTIFPNWNAKKFQRIYFTKEKCVVIHALVLSHLIAARIENNIREINEI